MANPMHKESISIDDLRKLPDHTQLAYVMASIVTRCYEEAGVDVSSINEAHEFLLVKWNRDQVVVFLQVCGLLIGARRLTGSGFVLMIEDWDMVHSFIRDSKRYDVNIQSALEEVGL